MDELPPPEEDFSSIPIPERSIHKNWKARSSAYSGFLVQSAKTTSDNDPFFRPYLSDSELLKKWVTDSNAVAQDKAIEALCGLVRETGELSARLRPELLPLLVEKTFGTTRSSTKSKTLELVLLFVEVEGNSEGVVADVIEKGLDAKQPKIVATSIQALKDVVVGFGVKLIGTSLKLLLKSLPKIFGHTDKNVRAEGTLLVQALHSYLSAQLTPYLSELKPVQIKELTESFANLPDGTAVPARETRKQSRERAIAEADIEQDGNGDGAGGSGVGVDEALIIEDDSAPLDPTALYPPNFFEDLASTKWKERNDTLVAFLAALSPSNGASTLKMSPSGDLTDLFTTLGKMISKDANVNVVMLASDVIGSIATGMSKMPGTGQFGKYRSLVVPPLLERGKEKKPTVGEALGRGLDGVFSATNLHDNIDDIVLALASKNPQVKESALKFLNRSLSQLVSEAPPSKGPLLSAILVATGDSFEPVRTAVMESLGIIAKILGERMLNPVLDELDEIKKTRVRGFMEGANVRFKGPTAAAGRTAKPAPPPPPPHASVPKTAPKAVEKPVPAAPAAKKPAVAAPSVLAKKAAPLPAAVKKAPAASTAAKAKGGGVSSGPASLDFKYKFALEDAQTRWEEAIPEEVRTALVDPNWKMRFEAFDTFDPWLETSIDKVDSEVVIRFFSKVPGWNEKNFQVLSKMYTVFSVLAQKSPTFGRSSAAIAIAHLTEKLGDNKLKKPAGDALITFSERTSLAFVLSQAYEPISQKSPKIQADALVWVNQVLIDFGTTGLVLRDLIEFLKNGLKNPNALVRSNATKALVTLKLFVGNDIMTFLDDLNPQLLSTITNDFTKVEGQPAPTPSKTSAEAQASGGGASGKSGAADPLDDLIPRVELDRLVAPTSIIADSKSEAWKSRKEAMETLNGILQANTRLKPGMGEIGPVLKARLLDTNIAVKLLALDNISRIANGISKPFEKHVRIFVVSVCTVLADAKAPTRAAAAATLTAMASACETIEPLIGGFATSLENPNPLLRSSLLTWLLEWITEHKSDVDLTPLAGPVISCLEDRNADVRKAGQAFLPPVVESAGFMYVSDQVNNLKPAMRQTVMPMIKAAQDMLNANSTPEDSVPTKTIAPTPKETKAQVSDPPSDSSRPASATTSTPHISVPKVLSRAGTGTGARAMSLASSSSAAGSQDGEAGLSRLAPLRKPLNGGGLKRPASIYGSSTVKPPTARASAPAVNHLSSITPFKTSDPVARQARNRKDAGKWIFLEKAEPAQVQALSTQMEPHASTELHHLLFSTDHSAAKDFILGLDILDRSFANVEESAQEFGIEAAALREMLVVNLDLVMKYLSIRMYDSNPQAVNKSLSVIGHMVSEFSDDGGNGVRHSFDDAEIGLLLPTMIFKLGDPKCSPKIHELFRTMRYVVPGTKLFQLLVNHGLPLKNAKARVEVLAAMTSIAKATAPSSYLTSKPFALIVACLDDPDSKVKSGALDVLTEAYKNIGEDVFDIGKVTSKQRDQMEGRFKFHQAPVSNRPKPVASSRFAESNQTRPASPSVGGRTNANSPLPMTQRAPLNNASPPLSSSAFATQSTSPPHQSLPRASAIATGSRIGVPRSRLSMLPTHQPSTVGSQEEPSHRSRPTSSEINGTSTQDRALRPLNGTNGHGHHSHENGRRAAPQEGNGSDIAGILSNDPERSVAALKRVEATLETAPLSLMGEGPVLMLNISHQMNIAFEQHDLSQQSWYRLVKHLIQTLHNFCQHSDLHKSLDHATMTLLLNELTLRLLMTDESPLPEVKEFSRYLNTVILRLFSTGNRATVFSALFEILYDVTKDFVVNHTTATSREAKHAELVLKCVWKRARSVEEDLAKNAIKPSELLPVIENFLRKMPPNEWRKRSSAGIPLADMPLRTVKVILQHIVGRFPGDSVYDQLSLSFAAPEDTHCYSYIFRLVNQGSGSDAASIRSTSTRPPAPARQPNSPKSLTSPNSLSPTIRQAVSAPLASTNSTQPPDSEVEGRDALESRLIQIIKQLGSSGGDAHKTAMNDLYDFLKAHPEKRERFEELLKPLLGSFALYVKRALANKAAADPENTSPTPASTATFNSATPTPASPSSFTKRPTILSQEPSSRPVSVAASLASDEGDERLEAHKRLFQYDATSSPRQSYMARVPSNPTEPSPLSPERSPSHENGAGSNQSVDQAAIEREKLAALRERLNGMRNSHN